MRPNSGQQAGGLGPSWLAGVTQFTSELRVGSQIGFSAGFAWNRFWTVSARWAVDSETVITESIQTKDIIENSEIDNMETAKAGEIDWLDSNVFVAI